MTLTKEGLAERLKNLNQQREQLIGNINATVGAIQVLEQLLVELNKEEVKEEVKTQ
jgi:hypothetical protein